MATFRPRNYMLAAWAGLKAYRYVVVLMVLGALFLLKACGGSAPAGSQVRPSKAPPAVQPQITSKDALAMQVNALKQTVESQARASGEAEKAVRVLTSKLDAAEKARAEDAAEQARRFDQQQRSFSEALRQTTTKAVSTPQPKPTPAPRPAPTPPHPPAMAPSVQFQMRTLKADPQKRPSPPLANAAETPFMPVGCFAEVKVVGGLQATSQVTGDAFGDIAFFVVTSPFTCPSKLGGPGLAPSPSQVELAGCFVMGKAKAAMATSRVQAALEQLSCVLPNGHAYEQPIKAYAIGRDRRQGIFGTLEYHESAKAAKVALIGIVEEGAKLVQAAQAKVLITGTNGGGMQMQSTLQQLGQLYLEQARALLPTLTVESETKAYIVLQESFAIPDYPTFSYLQKGTM